MRNRHLSTSERTAYLRIIHFDEHIEELERTRVFVYKDMAKNAVIGEKPKMGFQ